MEYPVIALLVVKVAEVRRKNKLLTNVNWVTETLFKYQKPEIEPLTDTESECVRLAQELRPKKIWDITSEQVKYARKGQIKSVGMW